MQQNTSKTEVDSNTVLPPEMRNASYKHPNLTPAASRKRRTMPPHPQVSRSKEIIKTRAEINEIEMKKKKAKINKTKNLFFEKIDKIDRPLAGLIKKKRERTQ